MRSRSLRREGTSTAEQPASRGDGRHCSLCWTGIYLTQPQGDQLAAPPRWAGIATAAPAADIRPGAPTTLAEIGTACGARATRANAGFKRANGNCCPHAVDRLPGLGSVGDDLQAVDLLHHFAHP